MFSGMASSIKALRKFKMAAPAVNFQNGRQNCLLFSLKKGGLFLTKL
jgi:hypothetical protein